MGDEGISEYFRGRSVLLTGGTGCVGSAILEKLLRSCPGLQSVFLLIREKKGKDAKARLEDLFKKELFSRISEEFPSFREKVIVVEGDLQREYLGLNDEDQAMLREHVSVVLHSGATVRFTDTLRTATLINVAGTRNLLEFATTCPDLQSLVFISTAFCLCKSTGKIEEKVYPVPDVDPKRLIECAEWMNDEQLNAITPILCEGWPMTYSFTKACAEKLVDSYKNRLPVVIYRPSVVISSLHEPIPGYTDTFMGLNGMFTGGAAGVLRTALADKSTTAEVVPLDYTVNGAIAVAWARAKAGCSKNGTTEVYNMVSSRNPRTWDYVVNSMKQHFQRDVPLERVLWYPLWFFAASRMQYVIFRTLMHLLPAFLLEAAASVFSKLPRLSKLYKRAHELSDVTATFLVRNWVYDDSNMLALSTSLSPRDRQEFPCNMADVVWTQMLFTYAQGLRRYLMKQDPSSIPQARSWIKILQWIHYVTVFLLSLISLRLFYSFCCLLMTVNNYIASEYISVK